MQKTRPDHSERGSLRSLSLRNGGLENLLLKMDAEGGESIRSGGVKKGATARGENTDYLRGVRK